VEILKSETSQKILSLASGYRGAHSVLFRVANQQVMKALRYSYVGRKQKKEPKNLD
jgi:large subunit ribosomal protein L20